MAEPRIVDTQTALAEEYAAIGAPDAAERTALCLSGGGIRSAAFGLGVLQALAEHRLLARFHYLSTVSGGGFIGGWLSMLVRAWGAEAAQRRLIGGPDEQAELRALRDFSNYLTPRGGMFSIDTWTALVLVGRNLILNWLVFLPWFLAAAVLASLYVETLVWAGHSVTAAFVLVAPVLAGLTTATLSICLGLPSHRRQDGDGLWLFLTPPDIDRWIVAPALVWAAILPLTFFRHWPDDPQGREWVLPAGYVAGTLLAYGVAAIVDARRNSGRPGRSPFLTNLPSWLVASAAAALFLWVGLWLGRTRVDPRFHAELLAVAGPLWFVLTPMLHAAIHVGLRPEAERADLDREWLARISAIKLRFALLWTVFAGCCLVLPRVLDWVSVKAMYGALAAGPVGAWLGKQVLSRATGAARGTGLLDRAFSLVPPALCVVFMAALFAVLGGVVEQALDLLVPPRAGPDAGRPERVLALVVAALVLAALGWRGGSINVNRFSLHGMYRNRITRAFLGSARKPGERKPEPLTGFDDADVVAMASLDKRGRLFHVVNTTLNLSVTERLSWGERKAAPFTVTPLHAGSAALRGSGAYIASAQYAGSEHAESGSGDAGGIRLAGALTVSGAAVSPNWGYNSSPITAFVMTLFNVRLGAWLPNPAVALTARQLAAAMPPNSGTALFRELIGWTDARSEAIYLSDGGHFDNLGLFEMVRRECRFILVVDAGQDETAVLRSLGDAVRKAEIDLHTFISIDRAAILSRADAAKATTPGPPGYAVGRICYPGGAVGVLVYLKASWLRGLPIEVQAYADRHPDFPHEPTYDQSFNESQFESYRALGREQGRRMLRDIPERDLASLRGVFEHLRDGS